MENISLTSEWLATCFSTKIRLQILLIKQPSLVSLNVFLEKNNFLLWLEKSNYSKVS